MEITKSFEQVSKSGKTVKVSAKIIREIVDSVDYSDGWNLKNGKETVEIIEITVTVDGKIAAIGNEVSKIERITYGKSYDSLVSKGIYGRIGDMYITEETYNKIVALLDEIKEEMVTPEFDAMKNDENKRIEIDEFETEPAHGVNGYCRKCHSYCDGDCEEN